MAQVVNHCVDPKTNKPTFSDVPCEKLGMFTKKTIDGSKMSKADGLPRTNYVDENGKFIANRPVGWYEKTSDDSPNVNTSQSREAEIVIKCRKIHQDKLYYEGINSSWGRNKAADMRYEFSKNNCHLIIG